MRRIGWMALCLAVIAGFAGWALHPPSNLDVDWYLLGARTLLGQGDELYVSVRDPNPPAVWQLFLGMERLAEWTGLPAHRLFYGLTALAGVGLLAWTAKLLPRTLRAATLLGGAFFAGFAAFVESGQRDVLAALMILPYLAWTQRLSEGPAPQRAQGFAATAVAGLTLLLKPHFLLYFIFAETLLLWRSRSPSTAGGKGALRADLWLPLFGVALLGAAQLALYPAYLDYVRDYGAFYLGWAPGPLTSRALVTLLMLVALLGVLTVTKRLCGWAATLAGAAVAALLVALVQNKWWDYQTHPILLFTGLAWTVLLAEATGRPGRGVLRAVLISLPVLWIASLALQSGRDHWRAFVQAPVPPTTLALAAAIDRLAPGQPIAILGSHAGAVAAYLSSAAWALGDPPFWVIQEVGQRRLDGAALSEVERDAEQRYLAELADRLERHPPVLLAIHRGSGYEPDALAYLRLDARLAALLDSRFAPAGDIGGYDLFRPR